MFVSKKKYDELKRKYEVYAFCVQSAEEEIEDLHKTIDKLKVAKKTTTKKAVAKKTTAKKESK